MIYLSQRAEEGLEMVAGNGVSDESPRLAGDESEVELGIEQGEVAVVGLPSPVEVAMIWPSVLEAVLMFLDEAAGAVVVGRARRVMDPVSLPDVAAACKFPLYPNFSLPLCPLPSRSLVLFRVSVSKTEKDGLMSVLPTEKSMKLVRSGGGSERWGGGGAAASAISECCDSCV
jgi:hypothetical protein